MKKRTRKDPNRYPVGWTAARVKSVIDHYEHQSAEEAIAEADRAFANARQEWIAVPLELVPVIRELLARFDDRRTNMRGRGAGRTARSRGRATWIGHRPGARPAVTGALKR